MNKPDDAFHVTFEGGEYFQAKGYDFHEGSTVTREELEDWRDKVEPELWVAGTIASLRGAPLATLVPA